MLTSHKNALTLRIINIAHYHSTLAYCDNALTVLVMPSTTATGPSPSCLRSETPWTSATAPCCKSWTPYLSICGRHVA